MTARNKPVVNKKPAEAAPEPAVEETKAVEHELGLHVSVKGPVKDEMGDYMHPQDLARYELFRAKRHAVQAKMALVDKEETNLRMLLKWQEQTLRIAKLEHDAKQLDLKDLRKLLDRELKTADSEMLQISTEIQEKYKLTPETLIYDDISGKLMPIDD